jgi:hypothetical protein
MSYIYEDVDDLEGTAKVGTKQCVALLQHYSSLPHTSLWKEGKTVLGDFTISKGTAIATFVGGKYESLSTGNHAAYFISQDANGITIMDQWSSDTTKPKVSSRYLRKKGKTDGGAYNSPSNNAEAFSVID